MTTKAMCRPARILDGEEALDAEMRAARWVYHRLLDFEDQHQAVLDEAAERAAAAASYAASYAAHAAAAYAAEAASYAAADYTLAARDLAGRLETNVESARDAGPCEDDEADEDDG